MFGFGKSPDSAASNDDAVAVVQRALGGGLTDVLEAFPAALDALISQQLWRARVDAAGVAFASFGAFVVASAPHGLNVRSLRPLLLLRHGLLAGHWYSEWVDTMERHVREPGRPTNGTNGEDFPRVYKVSRSLN